MRRRPINEANGHLLSTKLFDNYLFDEERNHPDPQNLDGDEPDYHWLKQARVGAHPALAWLPFIREIPGSRNPGLEPPGVFFDSRRLILSALSQATESLRRKTMDKDKGADEFHDSESEDVVYDLYNACNGVLRDGLLDISKLDEFTPEESKALNVPRLKEIWKHTASGCLECQKIIATLNAIRETLREEQAESFQEITQSIDISQIESIS